MDEETLKWLKDSVRYLCVLQSLQAESTTYGWNNDFAMKELRNNQQKFYSNETITKHFELSKLTKEQCKLIGFKQWDDESDVLLFPLWYIPFIQDGQLVTDINGETYPYKKGKEDLDVRFGCVAFGISESFLNKKITVNSMPR